MGEQYQCVNFGCERLQERRNATSFHNWCSRCKRQQRKGEPLDDHITSAKKDFCENILDDSPLPFDCRTTHDDDGALPTYELILDHYDGDRSNNSPENLRTWCRSCNYRKGMIMGDYDNTR